MGAQITSSVSFYSVLFNVLHQSINDVLGQLEETLLRDFISKASIRRWLSGVNRVSIIKQCYKLLQPFLGNRAPHLAGSDDSLNDLEDDRAGTFLGVGENEDDNGIDEEEQTPLYATSIVTEVARMRHAGVLYTRASTHVGNSLVLYHRAGDRSTEEIPASIQRIHQCGTNFKCFVKRHKKVSIAQAARDPFKYYKYFDASLYSSALQEGMEEIEADWIKCHFARYPWSESQVVVVSLSM